MKIKLASLLTSAALLGMFGASSAMAAQIGAGQINTGGNVTVFSGSTIDQATGLDFLNILKIPGDGDLSSLNGSGAFSTLFCPNTASTCGKIKDILNFSNFTNTSDFIISMFGINFSLNSPLSFTRSAGTDNSLPILTVSGRGILTLVSYDPTPAILTLSTQGTSLVNTTFSASIVTVPDVAPVPEPASLMLLGIGLAGVLAARRKKAAI